MPPASDELFAALYRDHAALLGRVARSFATDHADQADLTQEMAIALWRAAPRFLGAAKLSTYVYRVALNCALNWKRTRRRYVQKLEGYNPPDEAREDPRLRWLYARIHELPEVDRSLILLSLDRLSYGEIAEITGLSETNVGVRLHRIKQHLTLQSESLKNEI
ncbi:MAG TPA: sigma-70 family RNA polymerase sigma factor [Lacunisphaera sp.]|nr:sigma-70 family RNA polymerase sigma factor [Lacunisphaera sp.]